MENFWQHFNAFIQIAQSLQRPKGDINYREIKFSEGKKFVKIVSGGSAYCFVDKTNGDVLKAASWSKPAPHARGNIFNKDNGAGAINIYGANYLR